MSALHQIVSSRRAAVRDCGAFVRSGDLLLLVDAGVNLLWDEQRVSQLAGLAGGGRVRALQPDVEARGLLNQAAAVSVPLLTDAEWVAAVKRYTPILSWR